MPCFRRAARIGLVVLISTSLFEACAQSPAGPPPSVAVVRRFTAAWAHGGATSLKEMYSLLTATSAAALKEDDFISRYQAVGERMALKSLAFSFGSASENGDQATVPVTVRYRSLYAGSFQEPVVFKLARSGPEWRIAWAPEDILPQLAGDRHLREEHRLPTRGRILTRDGVELAVSSDQGLEVGVVKQNIKDEPAMLLALSRLLGITQDEIKRAYQGGQSDWFMPIRALPPDTDLNLHNQLSAIPGVTVPHATVRYYPRHQAAAQLVGYVSPDGVAQAGLEKSLDPVLGGTPGGRLFVVDGSESDVGTIVQRDPVAGQDVVLSLVWPVQEAAERALLADPKDAVVAEDPRSGEVLAMASHPEFDPNDFSFGHNAALLAYDADKSSPLVLRATSGQYPAGSTFKPITAAAGLKSGAMAADDRIPCPHLWTGYGPPGQENHESADLGPIDLRTAIARSCNTYFYEVGKRLYEKGASLLSDMAKSFGLGKSAGIQFVPEQPGKVPALTGGGEATNLAIGQGGLEVTPLQMADYTAALASGGAVPRPRVVLRVQSADGTVTRQFPAAKSGHAAVRPEDLPVLLDAMGLVVGDPAGTLHLAFKGSTTPVFGKSGTAETTAGSPDIWFIGGAPISSPSVVVAAVVEEKANGIRSLDAAGIGRATIDAALRLPTG
ncbi:MAG TPA: penicillin-binding transpeptidase domain-containing protein [Candidatus Dormibacteraeota bacterium]|nr:penicillin-binding transpeptidase domain-containing protein [Candidatus Dormibacteraeota bacterium]